MTATLTPADTIARRIANVERQLARFHETIEFVRTEVAEGRRTDFTAEGLAEWIDWQYSEIAKLIDNRSRLRAELPR